MYLLLSVLLSVVQAGVLPDPKQTPGAVNPNVDQTNISTTICRKGWTKTIRPPVTYTDALKVKLLKQNHLPGKLSDYELDHFISLELAGHPRDPHNLWMESYLPKPGAHEKDEVENYLNAQVCSHKMLLREAQAAIVKDWTAVYKRIHPGVAIK